MRMTIDLPDALFRQIKERAALKGRTLKALVTDYIEQGLARPTRISPSEPRHRSELPVIVRGATGNVPLPFRTNAELEELLLQEEVERYQALLDLNT